MLGGGKMNEGTGWQGQFDIFIKSQNGDWEHERTIKNTVVDSGLNLLREALRGTVTDAEIKYIAVGTSSASVTTSDTQLGSEVFRKAVFSKSIVGTGAVQTIAILDDAEAVANIQEIGVFAGSTASVTANSGIMISRILYSRNKTNLESVQIQRTDTIARG
jgi:hypothetical protein